MKCTKCGGVAVMNMPQHRLKLCADHYPEWVISMVQRTIDKYAMFDRDARILVAVSGGKDSLALWDILIRLGYETAGLYINLGIRHESYSDVSESLVEQFAAAHDGAPFEVVNVRETFGADVPELFKDSGRHTCSACGLVKRHIMNRWAHEGGYDAIATGHQVDDEAAVLMQNTLHWHSGYLRRQSPVLPSIHPRLARKVKPLCHLYERESAAYALLLDIPYVEQECPFSERAKTLFYKDILNQVERRSPGAKLQFYLSYLKAKDEGLFTLEALPSEMNTCERCGQPTQAGELCSFCRLWEAHRS
jgi:uncharacterized protein (TIGR00269 family)